MKKLIPLFLSLALLLSGCGPTSAPAEEDNTLTVAAMTYPIYLFTSRVIEGAEGVETQAVINQPMSCLHDYTLSVNDMKAIQGADLLLLNGVGLEDAMTAAIESSGVPTVDCSEGMSLLHYGESAEEHAEHGDEEDHDDHDHGEYDPHIWMDPTRAAVMVENIAAALSQADPDNAQLYADNAAAYAAELTALGEELRDKLSGLEPRELITFHEGFGYFADAMGLTVVKAIEEEAGSEASAKELAEILDLIEEYRLPAIFTEANGSDATANAVSRETGVKVEQLTMLMSAGAVPADSADPYRAGLEQNVNAILEAYE